MKRLAVLGHPVSHSRSPAMQNAALDALGLGGEWSYEAIDVEPAAFPERTRDLAGQGFVGANVTIPHKEAALSLANDASEAATEIGAANTLSFDDRRIRADNTDATGLLAALPGPVEGRIALVMGAGGSARAAVWALAGQGASVSVWNRTPERADELVRDLARSLHETGSSSASPAEHPRITPVEGRLRAVTGEQVRGNGYELIVNCTAIGMRGEDPFESLPLDPERFGGGIVVVDLVYAGSKSRLTDEARARGATAVEGLEVLVRQGAESLRIWTGMDPPLDVMREAARAIPES
jgi:shikimate dehydrogenase